MRGLRRGNRFGRTPPSYIYRSQARGRPRPGLTIPHDPGGPTGDHPPYPQASSPENLETLPVGLEHPLLPVKKPNSHDYRPVQDLREVNRRVLDIHPTVPNPYNLLSSLPPDHHWYTVLDLKDAFFSLPLVSKSQDLFAFEWSDLEEGINGQLTWTWLPQGFKNSPTIFDEALHEDLGEFR